MSLTHTIQDGIGEQAPDFKLHDVVSDNALSFSDVAGENGTVVMFICNHCPYVVHVREELIRVGNDYSRKDIGFVAISSNNVESHPQDGPEQMKELAQALKLPFPYLFDADQSVAKAYAASCTPDIMVYDGTNKCVYRGRLDGSTPGNGVPLSGQDLRKALDFLLSTGEVLPEQLPSMGCNIKWTPGNEPDYFA